MRKFKLWKWIVVCLVLIGCGKMGFIYKGIILKGYKPAIGGDMRIIHPDNQKNTEVLIFDSSTPANTEFKPFTAPPTAKEAENFHIEYTEPWMGDAGERQNHITVRLVKSDLKGNYQDLFKEFGQQGWWWISSDLQKIYILVEWTDYTDKNPINAIHLYFWSSYDGGKSFHKNDSFAHNIDLARGSGMVFDERGMNGYVFVNKNEVWHAIDGGLKWRQHYIPHTELSHLFGHGDGVNKDATMVDNDGNLLFSLFQPMDDGKVGANIYEISKRALDKDLSQEKPKYSFPGKRILAMSRIPDKNGFYMFFMECEDNKECNWNWEREKQDQNPTLRIGLFEDGELVRKADFGFFLPVKDIYVGDHGDIGVTLKMPNTEQYKVMISHDYGKEWKKIDLSGAVVSDYMDLKNKQYWLHAEHNMINELYQGNLP